MSKRDTWEKRLASALPVFHLPPSMSAVAIRTKQFQVLKVFLPFFEAERPTVISLFRDFFFGSVFMVYVQHTKVHLSALHALTAKPFYQFKLL